MQSGLRVRADSCPLIVFCGQSMVWTAMAKATLPALIFAGDFKHSTCDSEHQNELLARVSQVQLDAFLSKQNHVNAKVCSWAPPD